MMHRDLTRRNVQSRNDHRGIVLIAVVVLITISLTLFGVWGQTIVREHRRLANQQFRLQASRLAEAGVERAMARRAMDAEYETETWSVPSEQFAGAHAAEVRIRVAPNEAATAIRYEVTAEFPAGATRRAQVTKHIEIPNSSSRDES